MGMASVLLSDSSVCPPVHKAMLKLRGEKGNSWSWIFLSFCDTCSTPLRDDYINMQVYGHTKIHTSLPTMVMKI